MQIDFNIRIEVCECFFQFIIKICVNIYKILIHTKSLNLLKYNIYIFKFKLYVLLSSNPCS